MGGMIFSDAQMTEKRSLHLPAVMPGEEMNVHVVREGEGRQSLNL